MFTDDVCVYAGEYERGILLSIGTLNPVQSSVFSTMNILILLYRLSLYSCPQACIASSIGRSVSPSSLSEYSTLGGTSA